MKIEVLLSFDQGKYVPHVAKHKCTTLKQGDDQFHIWGYWELAFYFGCKRVVSDWPSLNAEALCGSLKSLTWLHFLFGGDLC